MVAAGLHLRKDDIFYIGMGALCNDPNEWHHPEKFIPERFDSRSEYYLTPSGKKRNPFSFSPFLGGMRICLGKTFVEEVSKVTLPTVLRRFWFEAEDPSKFEVPVNHMLCQREPVVHMILKARQ